MTVKSCKDCRWVRDWDLRYGPPGEFARCEAPQNKTRFWRGVLGDGWRWTYCSTQRDIHSGWPLWLRQITHLLFPVGDCGPLGSWWRPRLDYRPFVQNILDRARASGTVVSARRVTRGGDSLH